MDLVRYIAARLHRLHNWNSPCFENEAQSPDKERARHLRLGAYGELVAASYLRAHKVKILRQNWVPISGSGEIDIIARDGNTLCFIEVKSRASDSFIRPARAVDEEKREQIRKGAREWLRFLHEEVDVRYDIVEVVLPPNEKPRIHWIRGAFMTKESQGDRSSGGN